MLCSLFLCIAVVAIWLKVVQGVRAHADLFQNFEFGLGKDISASAARCDWKIVFSRTVSSKF